MTHDNTSGKGRYMQRVTIEVDVLVEPGEDTFNRISTDDLRAGIERFVGTMLGNEGSPIRHGMTIHAQRGPGASRYYFPDEGTNVDLLPHWATVDLPRLNVPTYVEDEAVTR